MANTLKFKRGLLAGLPTAAEGEPLFTTDTADLYIGTSTGNQRFQKYIASGATTQILRGDGSLYTFPLNISSPSNGQVLKYNGTAWVNDSDAGITGSGSSGQVAYFTGATTQAGNNNLFWDIANGRLGIGTNVPSNSLHVVGTTLITGSTTTQSFFSKTNSAVAIQSSLWGVAQNVGGADNGMAISLGVDNTTVYGQYQIAFDNLTSGTRTSHRFLTHDGSTLSERIRLDWRGNLGVGISPSTWGITNSTRAIQFNAGSIWTFGSSSLFMGQNYFYNGSARVYYANGAATEYAQISGQHIWYSAASGTAGNVISFSQPMTLTAAGRLLLGTTSESTFLLDVVGNSRITGSVISTDSYRVDATDYASSLSPSRFEIASSGLNVTDRVFDFGDGVRGWNITGLQGGGGNTRMSFNTRSFNVLTEAVRFELSANTIGGAIMQLPFTGVSFAPTSGSATFTGILMTQTINQTGGANGITRGLYVNPTLTAAADFRAIETSNNTGWSYYGAGSANSYFGGNIAVSTTNPATRLSIGTPTPISGLTPTYSNNDQSGLQWYYHTSSPFTRFLDIVAGSINPDGTNGGSVIRFFTNNTSIGNQASEKVRINQDGLFGIGTNNPLARLDVVGISTLPILKIIAADTNGNADFQIISTGTVGNSRIFFGDTAATNGSILYNHSLDALLFGTNGTTDRMRLTNNGNLFVGTFTSDTGEKLQVNGTSRFNDTITLTKGAASTIILNTTDATSTSLLRWYENGSSKALAQYINSNFATTSRQNRLEIGGTLLGGLSLISNGNFVSPPFILSNDGNLGLGVIPTNGYGILQINASAAITTISSFIKLSNSANTYLNRQPVFQFGQGGTNPNGYSHEISASTAGQASNNTLNFALCDGGETTRINVMTLLGSGSVCIGVTSGGNFLNIGASTTAKAQINLAAGTAPTTPTNGDIWFDGTDIKMRIGGVTKTFTLT